MIFFEKTKPTFGGQRFALKADFDRVTSSESLQNVAVGGKLTTQKVFSQAAEGKVYHACNYLSDYVAVTDGGVCYNDGTGDKTVMTEFADNADARLFFHAESKQLFATSAANGVCRFDGTASEKVFDKALFGMTSAGYRVCGFNGNTVYFSDVYASEFDVDEDGGSITFDSPVSGIAATNNTLFVFAHDLHAVTFSADQKSFLAKTVAKNVDNVTQNPCVVGGSVYFAGRHGLYKLSNNTIRRIADDSLFCNVTVAFAVYSDGKLAVYANGDNGGKIYFADTHTDKIVGCVVQRCDCLFDSFGQLYAVCDNKLLAQNKASEGRWTGETSCSAAKRYVRNICIKASGKVTVRVKTDKMSCAITAECGGKLRKLPVRAFGNTVCLSATLAAGATLNYLAAEGFVYRGEKV